MSLAEAPFSEMHTNYDGPIRFDTDTLSYILEPEEAELCMQGVLAALSNDSESATKYLGGMAIRDDGTIGMSVYTARKAIGGLDTLLESYAEEPGEYQDEAKSIYDLSLRLAVAIFCYDTTFGVDQMESLNDRRGRARRQRLIPYVRALLRIAA